MITFNLGKILKENNISQTKFSHLAKVRPNTVNDMCNGITRRVELETLNNILNAVNEISDRPLDIADLITYTKDGSNDD